MLRITINVYSGRANPSWMVKNGVMERKIAKEVNHVLAVSDAKNLRIQPKLGFRGLIMEPGEVDKSDDFLPSEAAREIPVELAAESLGRDLIVQLLQTMTEPVLDAGRAQGPKIGDESIAALQQFLLDQVAGRHLEAAPQGLGAIARQQEDLRAAGCLHETPVYSPGLWNDDPTVRRNNNCYNYACKRVTNTYAQPGRGCGSELQWPGTCADVIVAASCDGLRRRYDCLPDSEIPRYLVALVSWPNRDYHWYRLDQGGRWSHKLGIDPATDVDNTGLFISDPSTCNRGPYAQFCGYFYVGKSALIA